MAPPVRTPATYEDVRAASPHVVAELIDGVLHASPRPAGPHAAVTTAMLTRYLPSLAGAGRGSTAGWLFLIEPELHLGHDVLVPDLAGWRRTRLPAVPDAPYLTLAPDWVCEVLSPSTEKLDRARKLPRYAAAGVGHAWLLHPGHRTLEVLRRVEGAWLTVAVLEDDARARVEPFAEVELDLGAVWADLAAPAPAGPPTRASEAPAPYESAGGAALREAPPAPA